MNSFNEEFKTLLNKSRLIIEELRKLVDQWEINALLDDQMEILATMQKMLQNQLTQTKDPVRSSHLPPKTSTTATIKDHQKDTTKEIFNQPRNKRKRQPLTNSEDEYTDEYTDEYGKIQDELLDQRDALKQKKQRNAAWRRQLQN